MRKILEELGSRDMYVRTVTVSAPVWACTCI